MSRRPRASAILLGVVLLALLAWWCWPASEGTRRSVVTPPPESQAESSSARPLESADNARVEEFPPVEPPPAQPEPMAALRVIGRVLDGDRQTPLAGATVELADVVWAPGTHDPRLMRETVSAADGGFAVEAVPPAQYWITARLDGFTRERIRIEVQELSRSSVAEGASVSAGEIRLQRGTRLHVRAIAAASRAPVADASVYLLDGDRKIGFLGRTDERGGLAVPERISIRGEAVTLLALDKDGLGTLSLASGDRLATEREFEVAIEAGEDFLVHVKDGQGAPLAGAHVSATTYAFPLGQATHASGGVFDLSVAKDEGGRLRERFRVETDASGSARLHGLRTVQDPHSYRISAGLQGYSLVTIDKQQPEREPTPKEMVLLPQAVHSRLVGTVRTEDGSKLPTVTVRCGGRTTTADAGTGHYELSDLKFQTVDSGLIQATAVGWANERTYVKLDGPDPCVQDLTLFRAADIRGIVLDDAGAPAAGVAVYYRPYIEEEQRGAGGAAAEPHLTLTDGRFVIRALRRGDYALEADSPEMRQVFYAGPLPALRFPPVVARAGDTDVRIVGWRDCSVKGSIHATVVHARTRAPIDIASASLMPPGSTFGTNSPLPASFTIRIGEIDIPSVSAGQWGLWVLATNGGVGFTSFETTDASPSASVEVRVAEERKLSGKLVAAEGASPPPTWEGVRVIAQRRNDWQGPWGFLWGQRDGPDARTRAGADGSFAFDGLLPGRYALQAGNGKLEGMMTVEFTEPESMIIEFVLKPPAFASIAIEAPIELFDGLTMLRYWEGGEVLDDFALKADVAGQRRRTLPAEPGSFRIQAWRRSNASDKSEPKSFLLDESFELKADETRVLTIPAPR